MNSRIVNAQSVELALNRSICASSPPPPPPLLFPSMTRGESSLHALTSPLYRTSTILSRGHIIAKPQSVPNQVDFSLLSRVSRDGGVSRASNSEWRIIITATIVVQSPADEEESRSTERGEEGRKRRATRHGSSFVRFESNEPSSPPPCLSSC